MAGLCGERREGKNERKEKGKAGVKFFVGGCGCVWRGLLVILVG